MMKLIIASVAILGLINSVYADCATLPPSGDEKERIENAPKIYQVETTSDPNVVKVYFYNQTNSYNFQYDLENSIIIEKGNELEIEDHGVQSSRVPEAENIEIWGKLSPELNSSSAIVKINNKIRGNFTLNNTINFFPYPKLNNENYTEISHISENNVLPIQNMMFYSDVWNVLFLSREPHRSNYFGDLYNESYFVFNLDNSNKYNIINSTKTDFESAVFEYNNQVVQEDDFYFIEEQNVMILPSNPCRGSKINVVQFSNTSIETLQDFNFLLDNVITDLRTKELITWTNSYEDFIIRKSSYIDSSFKVFTIPFNVYQHLIGVETELGFLNFSLGILGLSMSFVAFYFIRKSKSVRNVV